MIEPTRRWQLENRPGHLVNRLARQIARYAEKRLLPLGIGVAGYPVVNLLSQSDGMTQKQLTEALGIEQPSTAQLIARLERDGFVERHKDPDDARSWRLNLSRKAKDLLPEINRIMDEGNDLATRGMSTAEIDLTLTLITRMLHNLSQDNTVPDPAKLVTQRDPQERSD